MAERVLKSICYLSVAFVLDKARAKQFHWNNGSRSIIS
jgi:hypothetical protein